MIIDVHCHYTLTQRRATVAERFSFEPPAEDGQPAWDACVAPRVAGRPTFLAFQWSLGLGWRRRPPEELDAALELLYQRQLCAPGPVERTVLLAFDRVHDDDGRVPPMPHRRGELGSDMYASNSFVRALCRSRPQHFLFGASVHPYRPNALDCLEEVFAAGACLLKWIPVHQNIDCRDPRALAVLQRCAALGLPVLVHYGPEFTLTSQRPEYRSVEPFLNVLRRLRREHRLPTVIVAHVATSPFPGGGGRDYKIVRDALLGEFADAPLYADISSLASWGKIGVLRRLTRRPELHHKLLFGSDFPVPLALPRLRRDLGRESRRIAAEPAWPHQSLLVFRRLGFAEIVFHRAATLLPNVDYFVSKTPESAPPSLNV